MWGPTSLYTHMAKILGSETFSPKWETNTLNGRAGDEMGISVDGRLETPGFGEFVRLSFNQRGPWGP